MTLAGVLLMLDAKKVSKSVQLSGNNQENFIEQYPRFEGCNIIDGIGFKHVAYLAEEALIQYFRNQGLEPADLYREYGLGFEVIGSNIRIPKLVRMGNLVRISVQPKTYQNSNGQEFEVQMLTQQDENWKPAVTGTLKIVFRQTRQVSYDTHLISAITPFIIPKISGSQFDEMGRYKISATPQLNNGSHSIQGRGHLDVEDLVLNQIAPKDSNNFVWKWRIPYFYCHYTKWMQHSGYLRLVEEVVDLFLENRGISIWTMLESHNWIPFVSQFKVDLLQDALMEETIYVVYTVENILKDVTYTSNVDFYVVRDGELLKTAQGKITHGYAALSSDPKEFKLARFDQETLDALNNRGTGK